MPQNAYALGRLMAALQQDGWLDGDDAARITSSLPVTLAKGLQAAGSGSPKITAAVARVGDIPDSLPAEGWADFWLGYYHHRAGKDRDHTDADPRTERYAMRLTPRQKRWLMANGGMERISRWIDEDMGPAGDAG